MGEPTGNVVDIDEFMPHEVAELMCVACKKRFIDVWPEGTLLKDLECPHCKGYGFIIKTGQDLPVDMMGVDKE